MKLTTEKRMFGASRQTSTLGSKRQPKSAQSTAPSPSLSMPSAQSWSLRSPSMSPALPSRSS